VVYLRAASGVDPRSQAPSVLQAGGRRMKAGRVIWASAFVIVLCFFGMMRDAFAQSPPEGFTVGACSVVVGEFGPGRDGLLCERVGEEGVALEVYVYGAFMCSDGPAWTLMGIYPVGLGYSAMLEGYCWNSDYSVASPVAASFAYRELFLTPPDPAEPPASAASGAEPLSSESAGVVMVFGGVVVMSVFAGLGAARWLV